MNKKISFLAVLATIILAVPICLGWISNLVDIAKTPERVDKMATQLDDIKTDLKVIKHWLGIPPSLRTNQAYHSEPPDFFPDATVYTTNKFAVNKYTTNKLDLTP